MYFTDKIDSPIGKLYITTTEEALTKISFEPVPVTNSPAPEIFQRVKEQLDEYFSGARRDFNLPVILSGSDFTRDCLQAMFEVPYAETISYSELAKRAGHPRAIRAAASVCAKNCIPIIYPCHRIVRKDRIGAYGAGVQIKRWLLEHEKINKPE